MKNHIPIPDPNSLWRYVGPGMGQGSVQRVVIANAYEIVSVHEFSGFALLRGGPQFAWQGSVEEFMNSFIYLGGMPAPYSATRNKT